MSWNKCKTVYILRVPFLIPMGEFVVKNCWPASNIAFSKLSWLGFQKIFFDNEKPNFYNVLTTCSTKCKTVYTYEAFFRLPSSTGFHFLSMAVRRSWRVIRFGPLRNKWIQENYATRKDQLNYAPAHFWQCGGRPPPSDPYIFAPASLQDDGSMDKPNSLKLLSRDHQKKRLLTFLTTFFVLFLS